MNKLTYIADVRKTIQGLSEKDLGQLSVDYDRSSSFPDKAVSLIRDAGIFNLIEDQDKLFELTSNAIFELSKTCAGISSILTAHFSGVYTLLKNSGSISNNDLKQYISGEKLVGYTYSGIDFRTVGSEETLTYTEKDSEFFLSGNIPSVLLGENASGLVVLANSEENDDNRKTAFFIDPKNDGFEFGEKGELVGLSAMPVCSAVLKNYRVSREGLVGEEGAGGEITADTEAYARMLAPSQALGIIHRAFDEANSYSKSRVQFGKSIGEFQALKFMLTKMKVAFNTGFAMLKDSLSLFQHDNRHAIYEHAAMTKLFITEKAMESATDSVQIFGGYGFMRDYPVEKLMRDAKTLQLLYGTPHHLNYIISLSM